MKHTAVIVALSVLAVVLAAFVVVFAFGTPQAPSTVAGAGSSPGPAPASSPQGSADAQSQDPAAEGEIPAPDPNSPLAIQIPGCTCHSDDPKVVEEHAQYRMNQCFGCHADGMPEMGG